MTPDSRRIAKQFTYGVFFCVFWATIIYGGYKVFFASPPSCFDNKQNQNETGVDCGGVCPDCALRTLKPVEVVSQKIFLLNGQSSALLELKNPNSLYGAVSLPYVIEVREASTVLQSIRDETFIYPGEVKYIVEDLPNTGVEPNLNITFGSPTWKPANDLRSPNMNFRGVTSKIQDGKTVLVSGNLQNNETLLFPRIVISALFYDQNSNIIGVSKTEIHDVRAFEERYFQIEHPVLPGLDFSKTKQFFDAKRP